MIDFSEIIAYVKENWMPLLMSAVGGCAGGPTVANTSRLTDVLQYLGTFIK